MVLTTDTTQQPEAAIQGYRLHFAWHFRHIHIHIANNILVYWLKE